MYDEQTKICEEQRKIIGIEPVIDMKNFIILLLADLASKSPLIYFDGSNTKTACLSTDYKRIIEDIMYQENGWGIKFASLINIYSYYEFQLDWERKLGKTLRKVLIELNKTPDYDFENDIIKIPFTEDEINNIKSKYDQETLNNMSHFSNLIGNCIFQRSAGFIRKDMAKDKARDAHNQKELSLRMFYKHQIKLAKPLNGSSYHKINHIDKK